MAYYEGVGQVPPVGATLRKFMEEFGYKADDVAHRAEVSVNTVLNIEKERVENPHFLTIRRIAKAFGATAESFLTRRALPSRKKDIDIPLLRARLEEASLANPQAKRWKKRFDVAEEHGHDLAPLVLELGDEIHGIQATADRIWEIINEYVRESLDEIHEWIMGSGLLEMIEEAQTEAEKRESREAAFVPEISTEEMIRAAEEND